MGFVIFLVISVFFKIGDNDINQFIDIVRGSTRMGVAG